MQPDHPSSNLPGGLVANAAQLFKPGDVIRNKRPYEGEHAYWVAGTNEYGYLCHPLIGKHSPRPNFVTKQQIDFHSAHNYEKQAVGNG